MIVFILWLVFSIFVAFIATTRGRGGIGWFFISALLSPLIGIIAVMCLPPIKAEKT